MKGQEYDILEPFTSREKKPTFFHRMGIVSVLVVAITIGSSEYILPEDSWLNTIVRTIGYLAFLPWFVSLASTLAHMDTREIQTIGKLVFYDDWLQLMDETEIKYEEITDFSFNLNDFKGDFELINPYHVVGKSYFKQGGNNYFTVTANGTTRTVRIRVKSRKGMEHLRRKIIPFLKRKTNYNNS